MQEVTSQEALISPVRRQSLPLNWAVGSLVYISQK